MDMRAVEASWNFLQNGSNQKSSFFRFKSYVMNRSNQNKIYEKEMKQGPAGQRWVLGHIKQIQLIQHIKQFQHIKHIKHFKQFQSWTAGQRWVLGRWVLGQCLIEQWWVLGRFWDKMTFKLALVGRFLKNWRIVFYFFFSVIYISRVSFLAIF